MKRFLIILMMLSGLSNAQWPSILELSFNGMMNGEGVDQAFTLFASDTMMIGVHCTGGYPAPVNWNLAGTGPGSLAGLGTIYTPPAPVAAMVDYPSYSYPGYFAYLGFRVAPTSAVTPGFGKWWDAEFHCDGPGLVTIMLLDTGLNVEDTITITQIPEPMTVALLALGAGFLRRRRK